MHKTDEFRNISISNIVGPQASFAFGESSYGDGELFGPMAGCQLEAIYLRTGQVEVHHDGKVFHLSAPCVAFVASHRTLEYRYGPAGMNNVLWCQYTSGTLTTSGVEALAPFCGSLSPSAAATSLMKIGAELSSDIYSEMKDFSSALGVAALEELLARRKMQETVADIPLQVLHVRRHIEEHLCSEITMNTLAKVSSLSPQYLNRLYKATYDENPLEYLWRLRVRRGAYLLSHTGTRISQIAYQTGFKTPNHFSRRIKEKYGLSPRQLRSQKWKGELGAKDFDEVQTN
ncbi:helix-turn-helix domain-containing protein [Candidatus Halocynthiibacter alkanivorans]|uniref:helix-turn-helix domain-containing protein n=1 Tax=Candidatus Halocynthiibacter alkanivorans TaxID=2267619 RepID=UPI000DF4B58D|nr:AraC family transcriptional regulator [Candidatus Halocynthiibacter alkanivorans]